MGKSKVNDLLESDESQWKDHFKECFRSLMTAPEDTVKVQLDQLLNRMASMGSFPFIILQRSDLLSSLF